MEPAGQGLFGDSEEEKNNDYNRDPPISKSDFRKLENIKKRKHQQK